MSFILEQPHNDDRGYKPCPQCQMGIEKTGGCLHVTCHQCDCHFCWRCGSFNRGSRQYTCGTGSCRHGVRRWWQRSRMPTRRPEGATLLDATSVHRHTSSAAQTLVAELAAPTAAQGWTGPKASRLWRTGRRRLLAGGGGALRRGASQGEQKEIAG